MNHTIKEQQVLKGIGQHKLPHHNPLTMDDVVGMVCFVGLFVFLLWLIGEAA